MPVRFHAALRDAPCSTCHTEHAGAAKKASTFSHNIIPKGAKCSQCHGASGLSTDGVPPKHHAPTDAVACETCHTTTKWAGVEIDHKSVWRHACDVCHAAPASESHSAIAGACGTCHVTGSWETSQPPSE